MSKGRTSLDGGRPCNHNPTPRHVSNGAKTPPLHLGAQGLVESPRSYEYALRHTLQLAGAQYPRRQGRFGMRQRRPDDLQGTGPASD